MKKRFNWKTVTAFFVFAALTGAVLSGCGQGGSYATQKNYITIGCVCPLSGELSAYGEGSLETEEAAVSAINETDGLYIDTLQRKLKVRFVIADSGSTQAGAQEAARKLIEEENIDAMICSGGTITALGTAKVCEEMKIPFFSVDADPDLWAAAGPFSYCFNCASGDRQRIEALSDLWAENGITGIGLMATASEEAESFAKALSAFCSENGYTLTDAGRLDPNRPDFSGAVKTLADAGTEALICFMDASDFSRAWQQSELRGMSLKMCILENDHLFTRDIAQITPGTEIQEFYTVTGWDRKYPIHSSITDESSSELAIWWEDHFLSSASERLGYKHASAEIAVDVIKLAMALDADSICSAARSLNVETILGLVDFDDGGTSLFPCSVLHWTFDVPTVSWVKELASHSRLTDVEFDD